MMYTLKETKELTRTSEDTHAMPCKYQNPSVHDASESLHLAEVIGEDCIFLGKAWVRKDTAELQVSAGEP